MIRPQNGRGPPSGQDQTIPNGTSSQSTKTKPASGHESRSNIQARTKYVITHKLVMYTTCMW
jgi:hypothetical protein